ncbi:MAG: hypothetical protein QOJ03_1396, partial [Frankiaceae bacterium]|nr:hypothetical protein [Frankiaceae bacterium]
GETDAVAEGTDVSPDTDVADAPSTS